MSSYYLPTRSRVEGGLTVLVGLDTGGVKVAITSAPTLAEAMDRLRSLACQYLVELIREGGEPLGALHFGEPPQGALVFTEVDLFPIVLRLMRRRRDWTQEDVAARIGRDQSFYSRLESYRPNPSLETCVLLEKAFGTTVHQVMYQRPEGA